MGITFVIHASIRVLFNFNLNISCPENSFPDKKILKNYKSSKINIFKEPCEVVKEQT